MVRVKRGKVAHKRRKRLLKLVKGFKWGRKSKYRLAKEAILHALTHAYRSRKEKKRLFRRIWQVQINAACRKHNLKYSVFMHKLKEKNIKLDRKILAELAKSYPQIFEKIVKEVGS
jgi:large subunit ribosomal protein L20